MGKLSNTSAGDRHIVFHTIANFLADAELSEELSRWKCKRLETWLPLSDQLLLQPSAGIEEKDKFTHIVLALATAKPGCCNTCNVNRLFTSRCHDTPWTNDKRVTRGSRADDTTLKGCRGLASRNGNARSVGCSSHAFW